MFPTWKILADHILSNHPEIKTGAWARAPRTENRTYYNRARYSYYNRTRYSPPPPPPPPPENKIDLFTLALSRGRTEGEINAFLNLGAKFLGLSQEELKRMLAK